MGDEPLPPFRVGEWRVVPTSNVVERDGERVRLGPTIMQVLVTLAARPGEIVSREEMLDAVWSDTFVTDEVLSNAIWELRRALGDDAKSPRYVQTLPKRGYRLVAQVDRVIDSEDHLGGHRGWPLAVVMLAIAAIVLWHTWKSDPIEKPMPIPIRITSFDGRERAPALSPDGRRVAFFREFGLYVVSWDGGDPLLLRSLDWNGYFGDAAWSPDGEWIAFTRWTIDGMDSHEIRMMRSLGGAERFVAPTLGFDGSLDWSPSGDLLVATGKESQEEPDAIFLYPVDSKSGRPKRLTTPPPGPADSGDVHGRFSPDGSRIAFLRGAPDLEDARTDIFVQAVRGNDEARRVTHVDADTRFGSFDWLPDASGFLACIGDRLFHVSLASGELSPLELRESLRDVRVEGNRFVGRAGAQDRDIWRISGPGPAATAGSAPAPWITSRAQELLPRYSPDGNRVALISNRSGSWQIWVCDASESNRNCRQLTSEEDGADEPSWSPDGQSIAYIAAPGTAASALYVIDADGGVPERLTAHDTPVGSPSWSIDGGSLFYSAGLDRSPRLVRMSLVSRVSEPIGQARGPRARPSEDGRYLYFSKSWAASPIARIPLDGGDEEIVLQTDPNPGHLEWDLWKNQLVYLLWRLPYVVEALDLDSGATRTLATLPVDYTPHMGLSVSPDGSWILATRNEDEWDIVRFDEYLDAIPY